MSRINPENPVDHVKLEEIIKWKITKNGWQLF